MSLSTQDGGPIEDAATPNAGPVDADLEPATDAADEASADEPADIDAEDEKDLARLDGAHRDETAGEETVRSNPSGSLLDLADCDDEPVSAGATAGPAKAEARGTESQPAAGGTPQGERPGSDDDSMTSADFRDAEDNEDWAQSDEDAASPDETGRCVRRRD